MNLCMTQDIHESMIRHAREVYPRECCGMLAGEDRLISAIFPFVNRLDSENSFWMDPADLILFFKKIRAGKLHHLGIYHSHPATRACPSPRDIREAFYPDCSHFIVSLENLEAPVVQAFRVLEGEVTTEEIILVGQGGGRPG
jgi:proteasome lid subunit RPN8/RPN11